MTSSIQSPADLCNNALVRIGYKGPRIGNLYDGSRAAKTFLDIYSQTRDELLRTQDWGFAYRSIDMTLLKPAPPGGYVPPLVWTSTYPPTPWLFEYAYPTDCLRVRAVNPVPIFVPDFDPQTHTFSIYNDSALDEKTILCNIPPTATLNYTGQVTDPTQWEADFCEVLAAALGRRAGPALASIEIAKLEAQDEAQATAEADMAQG